MPANKINLLPSEEFEDSTFGRVLRWALTTFRVIVIGVEVVVIAAFLSRFFLDAKNNDLTDEIEIKQARILAEADFEKEFRLTQKRLDIFSVLSGKQEGQAITSVSSAMPSDVVLETMTVDDKSVLLKGRSTNEASISQFIVNLDSSEEFEKVSLSSVVSSDENIGELVFTLTLVKKV